MNQKSLFSLVACALSFCLPACALTNQEVITAIEKAKILDPSIRVNAQVSKDVVWVATYKNPKANDRDCKIEAVLLAKTIMDLAPGEVPRVEVRFHSQTALSKFRQVDVTAGDVKAFATGSLSENELIASITIKEEQSISDPTAKLTNHLQEIQYERRKREITSVIKGKEVEVTAGLDPTYDDRFVKLEAMRLAGQAFEAVDEATRVTILFKDPSRARENKTVAVSREQFDKFEGSLIEALKGIELNQTREPIINGGTLDLEHYETHEGGRFRDRRELLERMRKLKEAGVGLSRGLLDEFLEIENHCDEPDGQVKERIEKLSAVLSHFEENLKRAKEFKAGAPSAGQAGGQAGARPAAAAGASGLDQMSGGIKAYILRDPDAFLNDNLVKISKRLKSGNAEESKPFEDSLNLAILVLKEAGRSAEATKLEARLSAIRARKTSQP